VTFTATQRRLLDRAHQSEQPLNPERFDDAAVLLRAETLVLAGASGSQAIIRARAELAASVPPTRDHVRCPVCGTTKRVVTRPDAPNLLWPVCGHPAIVLAQPAAGNGLDVAGARGAA
jgi:hypothetical protein